jgi:glutamate synthase (NADPH/NADH) small chain
MFQVLEKQRLNRSVVSLVVGAPLVARKAEPGQFIILRAVEGGERIPLTIAEYNREKGTVRIIFQIVGATTELLSRLQVGDCIQDVVGPLGCATQTAGLKKVAVVGGGVGCAIAYPVAKKLHDLGCEVHAVVGFRDHELVILEDEFKDCSKKYVLMTDDGSAGEKGLVTDALQKLIESGEQYDEVIVIGPLIMMKFICALTKKYGIKTVVSMNTIMIDGTGMCGGCRLTVGGKTKFACVDGPEFDGHEIDFDEAIARSSIYRSVERQAHETACNLFKQEAIKKPTEFVKRTVMPVQEPDVRNKNFKEVALGYTDDQAVHEAHRCLFCKDAPCVNGCPVKIHIPKFIAKVAEGKFKEAFELMSEDTSLPAVCGRVCPQETQCEAQCVRGRKGEPVAIGYLERFVADWHSKNVSEKPRRPVSNGHRVAVVGSGPSGLACAGALARHGYDVKIFEALHLAGGVLVYGIPKFRLPKTVVQKEIDRLKDLGVTIETNAVIGRTFSIDELMQEYDAVFIGSGAGQPKFMNIKGENLKGVYSANEFLARINLMKAYKPDSATPVQRGKKVTVVGGGNVAMDAARCAKRLGAEVMVLYRRTEAEMPARREEMQYAG